MVDRGALILVLTSTLLGACTGRDDGDPPAGDGMTSGDDADAQDSDTDTDDPEATGSTAGPTPTDDGDGTEPIACSGDAPTCFRDEPGTCAHVVDELAADCEGREWSCPEGFAFESDLQCTPEGNVPCTEDLRCWMGGDCGAESYEPTCVNETAVCDEGDALECAWLCEPGDIPPDDCYDQGPGECGDFAPPPNCTDGVWTCPNGFDFGGYGEDCDFPGG